MPAAKLSRPEILARLLVVFRRHGYAGATLGIISQATGLGRASLYHHFPDGKEGMLGAVLDWLEQGLEATLARGLERDAPPRRRLEDMVGELYAYYGGGRKSCLIAILAETEPGQPMQAQLGRIFGRWIEALTAPLRDAGLPEGEARRRARDAVIRIEGALVVALARSEPDIFREVLRGLPGELLKR